MYVDYRYYLDEFKGTTLTEEEFNKFGSLGEKYIEKNTLSRVTEGSINSYPTPLVLDIKDCVCELAQFEHEISEVRLNALGGMKPGQQGEGIVKSKKAGEVTVSYDTSCLSDIYLNTKNVECEKGLILKQYLYPRCIGNTTYNLLSKVIDRHV